MKPYGKEMINTEPIVLQAKIEEENVKKLMDLLCEPLPEEIMQKIKDIYSFMAKTKTSKFVAMPDKEWQFTIELKSLKEESSEEVWHVGRWKDEEDPRWSV